MKALITIILCSVLLTSCAVPRMLDSLDKGVEAIDKGITLVNDKVQEGKAAYAGAMDRLKEVDADKDGEWSVAEIMAALGLGTSTGGGLLMLIRNFLSREKKNKIKAELDKRNALSDARKDTMEERLAALESKPK